MRHRKIARALNLERLEDRHLLAANILVVTNPAGAGAQPDDAALLAALAAAGNTIDADSGPFLTGPPTAAQLADVDVIVVSRVTTSGNYTDGAGEAAAWIALAKPMLVMAPHLARSSHWGLVGGTTIVNDAAAPTAYNAFPNPAHPFVTGFSTAYAAAGVQIDSLNATAVPTGATLVATMTVGTATAAGIVDIPAGAPSLASGGGNFGGRRAFFTMPDYPDKANQNYDNVLTANAYGIVLRIVDVLASDSRLEAESATLSGPTIETLNAGYSGTGYADYGATPGQYIQWTVNAPIAGTYSLNVRYANGGAANRPLALTVNGVVDQAALEFNPTGAWTTWGTVTEQVTLNAGANAVRLTMSGTDGPNIDYLTSSYVGPVLDPPNGVPSDLTANVASSTQINLFWSDNATNETEYRLERRLASGGAFVQIATLPANATSYSNTGLTASTQYVYRLRAANSSGTSDYSNEANATTLPIGSTTPSVTGVVPGPGSTGVFLDRDIVATVSVPNGGINASTLTPATVRIYPTGNPGSPVAAVLNTSGGGDIIVARPVANLAPNTSYTFEVTSGVKDSAGAGFAPFTSTFTTGTQTSPIDASIQFERVSLANVATGQYSCVTIGPDNRLYASGVQGDIYRWDILSDGTLGPQQTLSSFRTHNGGQNRLLLGLEFDPSATAGNLVLWATHSYYAFSGSQDFTGTVTRLSGPNLENVQDVIIHLPRAVGDHSTNQMDFGPDGKLYFMQGSMSAMGAPDNAWGLKAEHLLSAAVLRFDPALWDATVNGPLDAHTEDADPYNPFAPNAPLTIYATGTRNAYDLLWHSNGYLYVPTNGSAAGGNTPGTPSPIPAGGLLPRIDAATNGPYTGPAVPALTSVSTQNDYLFRITQNGYYGHPNPLRNEFVLNGGNPTSGVDPAQVTQYPVGTLPDRNWGGFAFDFGLNRSPNGVIEYKYGGFGGALVGKILVVRFSSGDDIIVLEPGLDGNIISSNDAIASFDGFIDPLDLVENTTNGHLYVSQYDWSNGGRGTIFLMRPLEPEANVSTTQLIFDEVRGGAASAAKSVTVTNTGTGALVLASISLTGADAGLFAISPAVTTPATIAPGGTLNIGVVFNPIATTPLGPKAANLRLVTNDGDEQTIDLYLGGLVTPGEEGNNEPSWQWINDTFRIPVNVGDPNPATGPIEGLVLPNANNIQRFVKAAPGPVTIEPLAIFSGNTFAQPAAIMGWYQSSSALIELLQFGSGNAGQHQEMNSTIAVGTTSFDPGAADFGMYSQWPTFPGRTVYSENVLNTFDGAKTQKHLVFPLRDQSGEIVPNAYLVGVEEAANDDYQDLVYIIRNVSPVTGDFDQNARVDGNDFLAWQRGVGTTTGATRAQGNADFDGDVDAADLAIWRQQFGGVTSAVAAAEPALAAAVVIAGGDAASRISAAPTTLVGDATLPSNLRSRPATDLVDLIHARGAAFRPVGRAGLPRGAFLPPTANTASMHRAWDGPRAVTQEFPAELGDDSAGGDAEHDDAFAALSQGAWDEWA
jgi:hypothetical protein